MQMINTRNAFVTTKFENATAAMQKKTYFQGQTIQWPKVKG